MSTTLQDFIDFFGLSDFFGSGTLTVQNVIGLSIVAFIGAIFCIIGVRCILEIPPISNNFDKF